jgi:hypothetical protein
VRGYAKLSVMAASITYWFLFLLPGEERHSFTYWLVFLSPREGSHSYL